MRRGRLRSTPLKRLRGPDAPLRAWFDAQGWTPAPFQREVWRRYLAGESGLLQTPTGSGKTLAALGGPLLEALALAADAKRTAQVASTATGATGRDIDTATRRADPRRGTCLLYTSPSPRDS